MKDTETRKMIPPGEAARRLSISTETLRQWALTDLIPSTVLPSGHRRYAAEDIDRIVEGQRNADER